jgi:dCTP deaminase
LVEALGAENLDERLAVIPLLESNQVGPASIDLRLGTEFLLLRRTARPSVNPGPDQDFRPEDIVDRVAVRFGEPLWLHPGQFVLGATLEYLRLPRNMGAYVLGRSSWGRVGLLVATAVMVQPGYRGALTLELVNEGESPIALYPGVRIAQLAVHMLDKITDHPDAASGGRYFGATNPIAARLEKEGREIARLERLGQALRPIQ